MKRLTAKIFISLLILNILALAPAAYGAILIQDDLEGTTIGSTGYKGGKGIYLQKNETLTYPINNLNAASGTIEFWIKPDWRGGDSITHNLVKYTGSPNGQIAIVKTSGNELVFSYYNSNSLTITNQKSDEWVKDEWHNIALTWNTTSQLTLNAYVDGIFVEKVEGTVTPVSSSGSIVFGTQSGSQPPGTTFDEILISSSCKRFDELEVNRMNTLGSTVCYFPEGAVGNALVKDYTLGQEYGDYFPSTVSISNARKEFYIFNPNYESAQIKITFYGTNGKIGTFGPKSTYTRDKIIEIPPMGRYFIHVANTPPPNPVPEFAPYLSGSLYGYVQLTGNCEYSTVIESTNGVGIVAMSSNTGVEYETHTLLERISDRVEKKESDPRLGFNYMDGANATTKPSTTWYFPWASTLIKQLNHKAGKKYNVFCETYLYLFNPFNPQAEDATVNLKILFNNGNPVTINNAIVVPAGTRCTKKLSSVSGFPQDANRFSEFSLIVTSSKPIVASSTVFYNTNGRPFWFGAGTHGMPAPATGLYVGDFNTVVSGESDIFIMNPNNDSAKVKITLAYYSTNSLPDFYITNNPAYEPNNPACQDYDSDDPCTWQFKAVTNPAARVTIPANARVRIPLRALAMQVTTSPYYPPPDCPYGAEKDYPCDCLFCELFNNFCYRDCYNDCQGSDCSVCPVFDPSVHTVCSVISVPNDSGNTLGVIYEHNLAWWDFGAMDWYRNGNFIGFEDTFDDYEELPSAIHDDLTPVRLAPNGAQGSKRVTRFSSSGVSYVTGQDPVEGAVYGAAVDLTGGGRVWYPMSADPSSSVTEIDEVNNTRCPNELFSQLLGRKKPAGYMYIGFWVKPNWGNTDSSPRVLLHIGSHAGSNQIQIYKADTGGLLRCGIVPNTGSYQELTFQGDNAVNWVTDNWYYISFSFTYNTAGGTQMQSSVSYLGENGELIVLSPAPVNLETDPPLQFPDKGQQISLGAEIPDASGTLYYPSNAVFDELKIGEKFGPVDYGVGETLSTDIYPVSYKVGETLSVDMHTTPSDQLAKNFCVFLQYPLTTEGIFQGSYFASKTGTAFNPNDQDTLKQLWTYFDPIGKQLWVNCTPPYRLGDPAKRLCGSLKDSYEYCLAPMAAGTFEYGFCLDDDTCCYNDHNNCTELEEKKRNDVRLVVYDDQQYEEPPIITIKLQAIKNDAGRVVPFAVGGPASPAFGYELIQGIAPGIERPALFVDGLRGSDGNDGQTWLAAKRTIQAAIDAAESSTGAVIFVAAGTYTENITLKENVILLGGYPSGGGKRDVEANETIINGSVIDADYAVLDGFTTIIDGKGDVYPPATCGDGVVNLFDTLEEIDFKLKIEIPTACQKAKGDVPTGTPPNCIASDGVINILDILAVIDKGLEKQNCIDYCAEDPEFCEE